MRHFSALEILPHTIGASRIDIISVDGDARYLTFDGLVFAQISHIPVIPICGIFLFVLGP